MRLRRATISICVLYGFDAAPHSKFYALRKTFRTRAMEQHMFDAILIAAGVLFFVVSELYTRGCEAL